MDIRNDPRRMGPQMLPQDTECTIVEGDFTISMITEENVKDEHFPVFKNLREITGALLVFHVR